MNAAGSLPVIENNGGKLSIINCTFINNQQTLIFTHFHDSTYFISNSTFSFNSGTYLILANEGFGILDQNVFDSNNGQTLIEARGGTRFSLSNSQFRYFFLTIQEIDKLGTINVLQ
jgi:hypothetical protein